MKIEGKLMHVNPYLSSTNNWAQMERNSIKKCRTVMTNKILVLRIKLLLLLSLLYRRHLKKKHIILSMLFHLQIKQRKYQIYSFLFSFPSYFLTYYILEGSIFLSLSLLLLFSLFVPPTKTQCKRPSIQFNTWRRMISCESWYWLVLLVFIIWFFFLIKKNWK